MSTLPCEQGDGVGDVFCPNLATHHHADVELDIFIDVCAEHACPKCLPIEAARKETLDEVQEVETALAHSG